jgi:hypothetical protein
MTSPECERDPRVVGEVAEVLPPTGLRQTIVVVGGSLLALHGLVRTLDVDTVRAINQELREAVARVARVARRHDLAPAWVNDSSVAFRPQTFVEEDCRDVRLDLARLLVLVAPLRQVFVMKAVRGQGA